jgi:hypothetical protein
MGTDTERRLGATQRSIPCVGDAVAPSSVGISDCGPCSCCRSRSRRAGTIARTAVRACTSPAPVAGSGLHAQRAPRGCCTSGSARRTPAACTPTGCNTCPRHAVAQEGGCSGVNREHDRGRGRRFSLVSGQPTWNEIAQAERSQQTAVNQGEARTEGSQRAVRSRFASVGAAGRGRATSGGDGRLVLTSAAARSLSGPPAQRSVQAASHAEGEGQVLPGMSRTSAPLFAGCSGYRLRRTRDRQATIAFATPGTQLS